VKTIIVGDERYTTEDLEALRNQCIQWRDLSFDQWPDAIPFTTAMSVVISVLAQVIEQYEPTD
jgi:hypothetical protein